MEAIQDFFNSSLGATILNVFLAFVILLVGYIIARLVGSVVRRLLEKTSLDDRLAQALAGEGQEVKYDVEDVLGKVAFWIIMLFAIVASLQRLGLTRVAAPIDALLQQITTVYLPGIAGAIVLLLIAWLVATVLKFLILKAGGLLSLDERLSTSGALEEGEKVSITQPLATAVFWFVFLFFLPAVLNTLGLKSIADPIIAIFDQILGYVPNLFGAAAIFLIGWFVARIVRHIVANLLAALGVDKAGEKVGLSAERPLSYLIGTLAYVFILLVTLIAALEQLAIDSITEPLTQMLTSVLDAVPMYVGAVIILVVAYYVARFLSNLAQELLTNMGVDSLPAKLGLNWSGSRTLSQLIGYLVTIVIMLFAISWAAEMIGNSSLFVAVTGLITFLWQVVLAIIILAIGLFIANMTAQVILNAGSSNAHLLALLARVAILVFAGAMALGQLGVADAIVEMAFGFLIGAIALAAALAFGLGSREIAGREVDSFLTNLRADNPDNKLAAPAEEASE